MTSYNEWLKDWLNAGKMPTHFYLRNGANGVTPVENPEGIYFPTHNMYGARSMDFVLNRKYDYHEHRLRFLGGHNNLYGWNSEGEPVCVGFHGLPFVPAYLDTIDRELVRTHKLPANMCLELEAAYEKEEKEAKAREERDRQARIDSEHTREHMKMAMRQLAKNNGW